MQIEKGPKTQYQYQKQILLIFFPFSLPPSFFLNHTGWARCDYIKRLEELRVAGEHPSGRMYAEQWLLSLPDAKARNFVTFTEHDPYQFLYKREAYLFPSIKELCPPPPQDGRQGIYYVTVAEPGKVEYRLNGE